MKENYTLTDSQFDLLSNKELFILKQEVSDKLFALFGSINDKIGELLKDLPEHVPAEVLQSTGKISRGENYLGFPWMVLDAPRIFSPEGIFAFRTICWWGHQFSLNFLLSGRYLPSDKLKLMQHLSSLQGKGLYICIYTTPWNHQFTEENYMLLDDFIRHYALKPYAMEFLKISKPVALTHHHRLAEQAPEYFELIVNNLYR